MSGLEEEEKEKDNDIWGNICSLLAPYECRLHPPSFANFHPEDFNLNMGSEADGVSSSTIPVGTKSKHGVTSVGRPSPGNKTWLTTLMLSTTRSRPTTDCEIEGCGKSSKEF